MATRKPPKPARLIPMLAKDLLAGDYAGRIIAGITNNGHRIFDRLVNAQDWGSMVKMELQSDYTQSTAFYPMDATLWVSEK